MVTRTRISLEFSGQLHSFVAFFFFLGGGGGGDVLLNQASFV